MRSIEQQDVVAISLSGHLAKDGSASTLQARQVIRRAIANPTIKSIFIALEIVSSDYAGTYELFTDIREAAKTKHVRAHIIDVCAGEPYWAVCGASIISCNQPAFVGGIGHASVLVDSSDAADKQGLKVHVIKAGAIKGTGHPGSEITPEQLAARQNMVDSAAELFFRAVSESRRIALPAVKAMQGKMFSASDAIKHKLIDRISTFDQALEEARKNAN